MSKINSTKKLVLEDYPADVRPWLRKLVDPLNRFLEQAYYALVNGLTIADNLKGQTATISIVAGQVYPVEFTWKLNEKPTGVWPINCSESTGAAVAAFSTSWTYDSPTVKVTFNGLDTTKKYTIKLVGLV